MLHNTLTDNTARNKYRIPELDALRGLAAISVVIFHFTINGNVSLLGWTFRHGVAGVDLFYMISGFVIFMTIIHAKRWQDFALARFARLYPAFWTCLLLTCLAILYFEPGRLHARDVLANLTMAPIWFGVDTLDWSYWTLLVELTFYIWIGLFFVLRGPDSLIRTGLATLILTMLFHYFSTLYPTLHFLVTRKIELLNHFPLFLSGMLFYQIYNRHGSVIKNGLLVFLCLLCAFYLHDRGGRAQFHLSGYEHHVLLTFFHLIFILLVAGRLRFLSFPILLFLGKISYCLYLIHQYVGTQLISLFWQEWGIQRHLALALTLGICIVIAYLVSTLIEIPFNYRIKAAYQKRQKSFINRESVLR